MSDNFSHPWRTEATKDAWGGTELMCHRLFEEFGEEYLAPFQIIPSRLTDLKPDKIRILWCHDLAEDPMNSHLGNGGHDKFHKIVFVSYSQMIEFVMRFGIPLSKCTVLHNSIVPIDCNIEEKPTDQVNIVYHTTPHRGLNILVPVFEKIASEMENVHLHVYSSFGVYGWKQRDEAFKPLFEMIEKHDNMTYYGAVSNDEVRDALKKMHIFAYPSIWKETGCLCLMEAMSAGLMCVHSSLGALPETASNWTLMYDFDEDMNRHANKFYGMLKHAITLVKDQNPSTELKSQKSYMDLFYSWNMRKHQWRDLLENLKLEYKDQELGLPEVKFTYGAR